MSRSYYHTIFDKRLLKFRMQRNTLGKLKRISPKIIDTHCSLQLQNDIEKKLT